VQSLADDLVGDVRAVEVAGVDLVDARRDGLAEDGKSLRGRALDASVFSARFGVVDRMNRGSVDFGVIGPERAAPTWFQLDFR
jgi:hypothetical protein